MVEIIEANWPIPGLNPLATIGVVLALALLAVWWLLRRGRGARRERHRAPDALDEGAAPAARNQALIDAPSAVKAAALAETGPDILGGIGEVVAAAAAREVRDAETAVQPQPAAVPVLGCDDLARIKGVGPKLVTLLGQLGVTGFAEIAAWSEADIDRIDARLGTFAGRIRRDNWVEQCKFLAADDAAGFEAKFGKL